MNAWSSQFPSWTPPVDIPPGAPEHVWTSVFDEMFRGASAQLSLTPQDPIHHAEGDVWTHTKMVVNALLSHPRYAAGNDVERFILWTAAALHDITKPQATKVMEDGRVTAPGHSRTGAIWARQYLWQQHTPTPIREMVCALIRYHQSPFHAFSQRDQGTAEFLARKISTDCSIELLNALAWSDMTGRQCHDQQTTLDNIEIFGLVAQELGCWDRPYAFPDLATQSRYILAHGKRDSDTSVYLDNPFDVYLLSGLPASGKDTWCQSLGAQWRMISYDQTRMQLGHKHGEHVGQVVHAVHDQARILLRQRQTFVWNATHLSESMRAPALNLIRQYGGSPIIVCLEAAPEDLMSRNHKRDNTLTNSTLMDMAWKWERPWNWEADKVRDDTHVLSVSKSLKFK